MSGYRIIFMGTPDFAVPTLQSLIDSDHQVLCVVTQPDKKKGRGKKLAPPPVKVVAEQNNIPVLQPTKIKTPEFLEELKELRPDLIVVIAYGRILPESILNLPPLGCINVHGSLLPRHRGAAPIQWAIIEGDKKAGITIMQMDVGMDTGDILLPAEIEVAEDETAGSLFTKLSELGAPTLLEALTLLEQNKLPGNPQDNEEATAAPPLKKEQGLIDWSKPAEKLHCLIRGLDPWPSSYSFYNNIRYRFFNPEIIRKSVDSPPGTVIRADKEGILIATGSDCLLIKEIQPEGKKRLTAEAYLCGHPLPAGSLFTNQSHE